MRVMDKVLILQAHLDFLLSALDLARNAWREVRRSRRQNATLCGWPGLRIVTWDFAGSNVFRCRCHCRMVADPTVQVKHANTKHRFDLGDRIRECFQGCGQPDHIGYTGVKARVLYDRASFPKLRVVVTPDVAHGPILGSGIGNVEGGNERVESDDVSLNLVGLYSCRFVGVGKATGPTGIEDRLPSRGMRCPNW